jgi:hypothetical protein
MMHGQHWSMLGTRQQQRQQLAMAMGARLGQQQQLLPAGG